MNSDKNLPLRTVILDLALSTEQNINDLLITYLNIETENRKAISNKSSNLSFRNKIDLLFDLGIFSKEEHQLFLLLMEFRNQFLHNIECNSFTYAVSILGSDRGNNLLKYNDLHDTDEIETKYHNGYYCLYSESLKILVEKIRIKKQNIKDKSKLLRDYNEHIVYYIDTIADILNKIFDTHEITDLDSPEVANLKFEIFKTITDEIVKIPSSEKYKTLQSELQNSIGGDKIDKFLK